MTESNELLSNVHFLKPRDLSLSDRLDAFLEEHSLKVDQPRTPRQLSVGINKIVCASCGRNDYYTRGFCICGHFLMGQHEDEFVTWSLKAENRAKEAAERLAERSRTWKTGMGISTLFLFAPLIQMLVWPESFGFKSFLWFLPPIAALGIAAVAEAVADRKARIFASNVRAWDHTSFVLDRAGVDLENHCR